MNKFKRICIALAAVAITAVLGVSLAACGKKGTENNTIRFTMPDGTPALSAARMFSDNLKIADKNVKYQIVAADNIAGEMLSEKSDVLIMPTNVGVSQIVNKGAQYKMVSVNVEGNLYIIGTELSAGGLDVTWESLKGKKVACIGENGTPGLIFRYIVENYVLDSEDDVRIKIGTGANDVEVIYVAEAPMALTALKNGSVDFAVVAEPAATAFGAQSYDDGRFSARMDLQEEYEKITGIPNYPQASMFVKNSLLSNAAFMTGLKAALTNSVDWVLDSENAADLGPYMKDVVKSASNFPQPSISRCNICAKFTTDKDIQVAVSTFLEIVGVIPNFYA